jgi:methionyl-tRNA formyltransferase
MRLAFLGTPQVAAETLRSLVAAGHEVRVVATRPDARRGRGNTVGPSPVKAAATELGLPVVHKAAEVLGHGVELGVVVAYGRIVRPEVLAEVPMVNVHFSLLPRWRGAAPVERAILAGDDRTGVCLMQLEEGLDTGPVFTRAEVEIGPSETAGELRRRLGELGDQLLLEGLSKGFPGPIPQLGEATYAAKVEPGELRIDFTRSALLCHRIVRAGRSWTTFRGKRLIVRSARVLPGTAVVSPQHPGEPLAPGEVVGVTVGTSDGLLELVGVQPEGKPAMGAAEWARGARSKPGERLGL